MTGSDRFVVPVLGAGGIGCGIAAALAEAGHVPLLVSDWAEHLSALSEGMVVEDRHGGTTVVPVLAASTASLRESAKRYPLVILTAKCQGTRAYAGLLAEILTLDGAVVSQQNGINTGVLAGVLGAERVIGGAPIFGAFRAGPGRVRLTGTGNWMVVGELDGSRSDRIATVAALTDGGDWSTTISDNIAGILWSKTLNNAMVNPLAVLLGLSVDAIMRIPEARAAAIAIAVEGRRVADAAGIPLAALPSIDLAKTTEVANADPAAAHQALRDFGDLFPDTRVSSLQDVDSGRATELPWFTGHFVDEGRRLGVATPACTQVLDAALAVERTGKRDPEETLRLLAEVGEDWT